MPKQLNERSERKKKTKTKKPTREDKYNSKIHCLIVVWCIGLHCIGLQCATSAQRPSPIFHLVCPSKSKNKFECCVHRTRWKYARDIEKCKRMHLAAMRTSWATSLNQLKKPWTRTKMENSTKEISMYTHAHTHKHLKRTWNTHRLKVKK